MSTPQKPKGPKEVKVPYKLYDWRYTKKVPDNRQEYRIGELPIVKWGRKDEYPLFLNELYESAPTQTGLINGKLYYLVSGGVEITPVNPSPETDAIVQAFINNGPSDFTFSDVLTELVRDGELYNGIALRGVWDLMGRRPKFLEHIDFDCIRTNKARDRYWYSEDWTESMQSLDRTGFREIPGLDLNNRRGEFLIYLVMGSQKKTKKGMKVYPTPPYSGCVRALMTEVEIQAFHLHEILNSYKSGTILFLPTGKDKSDEDKEVLSEKIKAGATDREAAGGLQVLMAQGANEEPVVLQLNGNDQDKRYLQTETSTRETIFVAHSVNTPALFGMRSEGKLGDTQELETGFAIFKSIYVKGRQKPYNELFSWMLRVLYGVEAEFKMNEPENMLTEVTQDDINNPAGPVTVASRKEAEFASRNPILKAFSKHGVGRKRSSFIIKSSRPVPCEPDGNWFLENEEEMMATLRSDKHYFATVLTGKEKDVLALIDKGHDAKNVSLALDISVQEVMNVYNSLSKKGLIKKNGELSIQGKKYLQVNEAPIDQFEIRYSYELRGDAPALRGESRPFCKALLRLDKLYTRSEIETISTAVGRDVWRDKGGWYHNPETDKNTPYCRHTWMQHLVLKQK